MPNADMKLDAHEAWFEGYARDKIALAQRKGKDAEPLRLKMLHTYKVLANARIIATEEAFDDRLARVCALAALYHDLARFDQYLEYGTFKDSQSRNHGLWAVVLLRQLRRLDGEEARRQVLTAISVHNKLAVPASLGKADCLAAHTLRDADKLDIIRVMDEHLSSPGPYNPTVVLSLPDDASVFSPKTIACALAHRPASYGDLRSLNDFRLLLGTWIFAMNSATSRRLLRQNGHAAHLVQSLPNGGHYGEARHEILSCLESALPGEG